MALDIVLWCRQWCWWRGAKMVSIGIRKDVIKVSLSFTFSLFSLSLSLSPNTQEKFPSQCWFNLSLMHKQLVCGVVLMCLRILAWSDLIDGCWYMQHHNTGGFLLSNFPCSVCKCLLRTKLHSQQPVWKRLADVSNRQSLKAWEHHQQRDCYLTEIYRRSSSKVNKDFYTLRFRFLRCA